MAATSEIGVTADDVGGHPGVRMLWPKAAFSLFEVRHARHRRKTKAPTGMVGVCSGSAYGIRSLAFTTVQQCPQSGKNSHSRALAVQRRSVVAACVGVTVGVINGGSVSDVVPPSAGGAFLLALTTQGHLRRFLVNWTPHRPSLQRGMLPQRGACSDTR